LAIATVDNYWHITLTGCLLYLLGPLVNLYPFASLNFNPILAYLYIVATVSRLP
jgi:hypothetical protein